MFRAIKCAFGVSGGIGGKIERGRGCKGIRIEYKIPPVLSMTIILYKIGDALVKSPFLYKNSANEAFSAEHLPSSVSNRRTGICVLRLTNQEPSFGKMNSASELRDQLPFA